MTKHKPLSNSPRVLTHRARLTFCEVSHVGKVPTEVESGVPIQADLAHLLRPPETPRGLLCCRSRDGHLPSYRRRYRPPLPVSVAVSMTSMTTRRVLPRTALENTSLAPSDSICTSPSSRRSTASSLRRSLPAGSACVPPMSRAQTLAALDSECKISSARSNGTSVMLCSSSAPASILAYVQEMRRHLLIRSTSMRARSTRREHSRKSHSIWRMRFLHSESSAARV